jgi:hypothetical protein
MADAHRPSLRAIFWAWLVAGCLDISSAFVIYLWYGVALPRGLQGIAAALIGREAAYKGGLETAALGLGLHFFIMLCVVLVFFVGSRFLPVLTRKPILGGIIYGPIVYLIMYWGVVQASRIGPRPHTLANDSLAITIHICLIGLPIALIISKFAPAVGAGTTSSRS